MASEAEEPDGEHDGDSAFAGDDDDDASSTWSLSSSILDYEYENGRRYHAYRAGNYFLPNDEKEQTILDRIHYTSLLVSDTRTGCFGVLFLTCMLKLWKIGAARKALFRTTQRASCNPGCRDWYWNLGYRCGRHVSCSTCHWY